MCQQGVNMGQLKMAIKQTDETIALAQEWLEELHHLADHGSLNEVSAALAQANVKLGEVRAQLYCATDNLDNPGGGDEGDVSVELV